MDADVHALDRASLIGRLLDLSRVGIAVARLDDGVVIEVNHSFADLVGRRADELVGTAVDDLGLWGELGPAGARMSLRDRGVIDGFRTTITVDGEPRGARVWVELLTVDQPYILIRATGMDAWADTATRYHELRETEMKYQALVEQVPAIIYTEVPRENGVIGSKDDYVSPQTTRILGYTPEDWLSDPGLWGKILHPHDRDAVLAENRRSDETGDRFLMEYRLIARDGRVVWIRDEAIRLEDPATGRQVWQGVLTDISGEVEARLERQEVEAKYQSLVEQLPAVVYLGEYGEQGDWLYISPQIERVMGYTPQEWLDHPAPLATFVHPEDVADMRAAEERSYATGRPFRAEYRLRRRDGTWIWVLDEAAPVRDTDGKPRYLQGILYDITERKEAEQRLVALDRLKNTLLHTLSHDLKEPLTAILGAASTIERLDLQLDPTERAHLLRTMIDRTKGMNVLLTDLLDLDRLDRGIVEPRRFPMDLAEVVRDLVGKTEVLRGRPVELKAERTMVNVDGPKVERMVENLLSNAARHTPPGSRIWVRVWGGEAGATIAVDDEGPGVPDPLKEGIFEPFERGPDASSSGSGIGLSLVARFAELHHGLAWVQDRDGGGASFRIFLPAEPA
ncbi:MAG TPA: PAS domain-containing protein [Actinomycetota bacterium]|nr:PAS domain-containing protein [Actinomycetota bacterium]